MYFPDKSEYKVAVMIRIEGGDDRYYQLCECTNCDSLGAVVSAIFQHETMPPESVKLEVRRKL